MATVYTDALYSSLNLGTISSDYFTLSALNNEVVLVSAGTLDGANLIGVAYNQVDWTAGTYTNASSAISALAVRKTLTVSSLSAGVASGDAPTTLTVGVSGSNTLALALLYADGNCVNMAIAGPTTTYTVQYSARTFDISDKNDRRMHLLGYR